MSTPIKKIKTSIVYKIWPYQINKKDEHLPSWNVLTHLTDHPCHYCICNIPIHPEETSSWRCFLNEKIRLVAIFFVWLFAFILLPSFFSVICVARKKCCLAEIRTFKNGACAETASSFSVGDVFGVFFSFLSEVFFSFQVSANEHVSAGIHY